MRKPTVPDGTLTACVGHPGGGWYAFGIKAFGLHEPGRTHT
jgi:hypothetical protein